MASITYHKAINIMAIIQKLYHKKKRKEKNIPHYLRSWAPLMFFTFSKETIRYKVPKAKDCHRQRCTLDVDNAVIGTISTTANSAILEVKHYREIGATSGERWEEGKLPPRKQLTRSLEILWPAKPFIQVFPRHCLNARSAAAFPRGLTLHCLPAWQRFTPGSMWLERKIKIPSVCCTALLHLLHTPTHTPKI